MTDTFVKRQSGTDPDLFAAEATSLRWLGEAGAPVVEVVSVSPQRIELQRLVNRAPDPESAREFGVRLARMHDAGAPEFGSPPNGYTGKQFIGVLPLSTRTHARWGEFYANERVLPYVDRAVAAGNLSPADEAAARRACEFIADGAFDDGASPSRLHGDLWSGNVMWTPDGVVLIDPAAHGGHRETDLAMLHLFGCPQLAHIIAGYRDASPLVEGAEARVPLHQMHPLAVHAVRHGPGYGVALGDAARATLALMG